MKFDLFLPSAERDADGFIYIKLQFVYLTLAQVMNLFAKARIEPELQMNSVKFEENIEKKSESGKIKVGSTITMRISQHHTLNELLTRFPNTNLSTVYTKEDLILDHDLEETFASLTKKARTIIDLDKNSIKNIKPKL